jgi:uncharacterized membrane protein YfcA
MTLIGLPIWKVFALVVLGSVAGASSGLLGIGGGIIMVPVLVVAFAYSQQMSQGTALSVMIPTALMGAFTYASAHKVNWAAAVFILVGSIVGARYGATLALVLPKEVLRTVFALLMVGVAVRMMPRGTSSEMGMLAGVLIIAAAVRLFILR